MLDKSVNGMGYKEKSRKSWLDSEKRSSIWKNSKGNKLTKGELIINKQDTIEVNSHGMPISVQKRYQYSPNSRSRRSSWMRSRKTPTEYPVTQAQALQLKYQHKQHKRSPTTWYNWCQCCILWMNNLKQKTFYTSFLTNCRVIFPNSRIISEITIKSI